MPETALIHYAAFIDGIVKLAADRDTVELTDILREYKELMLGAIIDEQGFFDHAVGDQIAAHWGGLPSQSLQRAALNACRAALRQSKALDAHAKLAPLASGLCIGICREEALSIELARFCPALRTSILIDRSVRELCSEAFPFEELEEIADSTGKKTRVFRLK